MFTHSYRSDWTSGTDTISKTTSQTMDSENKRSLAIAIGGPTPVLLAFTMASLKDYYIVSDQPVTLFTNSNTGAGGDVLVLAAGQPLDWNSLSLAVSAFTVDVTEIWFTNASAATANIEIRIGSHTGP